LPGVKYKYEKSQVFKGWSKNGSKKSHISKCLKCSQKMKRKRKKKNKNNGIME